MNDETSPGTSARRFASASMSPVSTTSTIFASIVLPMSGSSLALPSSGELGDRRGRVADPDRGAAVGADAKRLLAEDLGQVGQLVEPIGQIAVARERRDHPPIIGPHEPTTARRLADARDGLPPDLQRAREPRADGAGARRAARRRAGPGARDRRQLAGRHGQASPTRSPPSSRGSRCCTAPARRASGRPTSPASGGPSPRARSSCSRSTATSPTTRRTCPA